MSQKQASQASNWLILAMQILLVLILGLMALGAGVRTMNAGLSCPDWPLCFGQVIPDFHPAVWFEFVHRAYAGLVSLIFGGLFFVVVFSKTAPKTAKLAMGAGLFFLFCQIGAGALTVLWLVKWFAVTAHLMLATLFFCSVLLALFALKPAVEVAPVAPPAWLKPSAMALAVAVFIQIYLGGVVASTYAGSVCVDWPLCNGQWVPTWSGAIGQQIIHRFAAYALVVAILALAGLLHRYRKAEWMTGQLLLLSRLALVTVILQVVIGVANLMLYIPPYITVPHQTVGIILLAISLRMAHVVNILARPEPVASPARTFAVAQAGNV